MKIEVEIEDGVIPDGYEVVRIGIPKCGEKVVNFGVHTVEKVRGVVQIIIRDKWTPGNVSLKTGWVAMDYHGTARQWWWHETKPDYTAGVWHSTGSMMRLCSLNWTPPPCTGPEDSLREIKK